MARLPVLLALVMTLVPALAAAQPVLWKPCSTAELRAHSHAVVVGTIVSVSPGTPGPESIDRATLLVEQVLAGDPSGAELTLVFPGRSRGQIDARGQLIPEENPTHIRYDLDQEGIFFLLARGDGTYSANHPARFKPRFFLSRIIDDLSVN